MQHRHFSLIDSGDGATEQTLCASTDRDISELVWSRSWHHKEHRAPAGSREDVHNRGQMSLLFPSFARANESDGNITAFEACRSGRGTLCEALDDRYVEDTLAHTASADLFVTRHKSNTSRHLAAANAVFAAIQATSRIRWQPGR